MPLSSGKILLIFKAHSCPLVLDFWPGSDRWLWLNGYILSVKCICVCSRKENPINIALLKTSKKTIGFHIRTTEKITIFYSYLQKETPESYT